MSEVNNYSSVSDSYYSEDDMYSAAYDYVTGNNPYMQNEAQNLNKTYERKITNLIPEINIDDLIQIREGWLNGTLDREIQKKYNDINEVNAAIGLAYSLQNLRKILNDPAISDADAMKLYNTLVTYIEYRGNSYAKDGIEPNKDNGLDDIIMKLKENNNTFNFDWNGNDAQKFRELTTYIETSLKKIKDETMLEVFDKKKKLAEAYFTGNRNAVDYWSDRKEERDDR